MIMGIHDMGIHGKTAKYKKGDWVRATSQPMVEHWNAYWAARAGVTAEVGSVFKVSSTNPDHFEEYGGYYEVGAGSVENGPFWYGSQIEPWRPQVGERVRFAHDNTNGGAGYGAKGDFATVVRADEYGQYYIRFENAESRRCYAPIDVLEPALDEKPAATEFKVGDRVRMTKPQDGEIADCAATVVRIDDVTPTHKIQFDRSYSWANGMDGNQWRVEPGGIEAAAAPATAFKSGDRVRITKVGVLDGSRVSVGSIATITDVGVHSYTLKFKAPFGDVFQQVCGASHFELADEPAAAKFKVGDRVRVTTKRFGAGQFGKTGVVTETNRRDSTLDIEIKYDERLTPGGLLSNQYNSDELELIDEPATTLKIEAGKYYRTRDGRKVKAEAAGSREGYEFCAGGNHYHANGANVYGNAERDLVSLAEPEKPTIKVGDNVLYKGKHSATVREHKPSIRGGPWLIEFGGHTGFGHDGNGISTSRIESGRGWWAMAEDIELADTTRQATPTIGTAIVCVMRDGKPAPSTAPFVHETEHAANIEAGRMAGLHKGETFGVYTLRDTVRIDPVAAPAKVYDHEWQRLAADGEKIRAIKELRRITGLGLKPTKDAVEGWLAAA